MLYIYSGVFNSKSSQLFSEELIHEVLQSEFEPWDRKTVAQTTMPSLILLLFILLLIQVRAINVHGIVFIKMHILHRVITKTIFALIGMQT